VNSDQDRQRAEKIFKKEERARDGREAMTEYQAEARAIRDKTARLKALRLDRDAPGHRTSIYYSSLTLQLSSEAKAFAPVS
jgi:hypothetical protein